MGRISSNFINDQNASLNFSVAKVVSILVVAVAHFYPDSSWWIAATVALFVFGYSSSFFTFQKYQKGFVPTEFWRRKIVRLGPNLFVINLFLFLLFLWQQKPYIFTWQTPVNMLGLPAFFMWFGLENHSPFGKGLWFFTVLVLFYLFYPLLEKINREPRVSGVITAILFCLFSFLHYWIPLGYSLWLTIFGFIWGGYCAKSGFCISKNISLLLIALGIVLMGVSKFLIHNTAGNYFFIVMVCLGIVSWLSVGRIQRILAFPLIIFSGCILEIYFVHSYLFVYPTSNSVINLLASFAFILPISFGLWKLSMYVFSQNLFESSKRSVFLG